MSRARAGGVDQSRARRPRTVAQALGVDVHEGEGRGVRQLRAAQDVADEVAGEDRRAGADEARSRIRRAAAASSTARARAPRRARASAARRARAPGRRCRARAPTRPPKRRAGSVKVMSSWWALKSSRKESSSIGSPRGVRSAISWPLRKTPRTWADGCCQSRWVMRRPSGRNHQTSGRPEPSLSRPARNLPRRKTGWALRSSIRRLVNSRCSPCALAQPPLVPGELVVLAPGVVVAVLRAAELVAAEQHRHALGEEQRGEEVALLAPAQRVDLGVVGLALDAAVPRAVVVGAVAVVLAVGLVVLLVVGRRGRAA